MLSAEILTAQAVAPGSGRKINSDQYSHNALKPVADAHKHITCNNIVMTYQTVFTVRRNP